MIEVRILKGWSNKTSEGSKGRAVQKGWGGVAKSQGGQKIRTKVLKIMGPIDFTDWRVPRVYTQNIMEQVWPRQQFDSCLFLVHLPATDQNVPQWPSDDWIMVHPFAENICPVLTLWWSPWEMFNKYLVLLQLIAVGTEYCVQKRSQIFVVFWFVKKVSIS